MKKRRLRNALLNQFLIITSCGFCIIIGMLIFSRGYLLNRKVISEKSTKEHQLNRTGAPKFTKMIFVLVDALRYDFVQRMPFLSDHCSSPDHSTCCAYKCISDPPTTTMQRLKALTTGTMPTFVDVSANFNSYEIEEDSLIYQFDHAGYKIGFLGDDTWLSLFPQSNFRGTVEGHPSFNAWDLDTVDYAINSTLHSLLMNPDKHPHWDVLILHYLGIDHCGHRYGPNHVEMERKQNEIDAALRFIYESMDFDTLLVVVGDHGMTATGDHGGDSKDEVESGLLFLTKAQSAICNSNLLNPKSVSQIDLIPTLATIFRVPIPFSSLGEVIPVLAEETYYLESLLENVLQVRKYIETYGFSSHHATLSDIFNDVVSAYEQFKRNENSTTKRLYKNLATHYLARVKEIATSTWTQFDLAKMMMGIGLCVLALISLIFSTVQDSRLDGLNQLVNFLPVLGIFICSAQTFLVEQGDATYLFAIILVCLCVLIVKQSVQYSQDRKNPSASTNFDENRNSHPFHAAIPVLLYGFTCFGLLSNSFVINEGSILGTTFSFLLIIHCLLSKSPAPTSTKVKKEQRGWHIWFLFLGVGIISRASQIFFRCREELTTCTEEFLLHKNLSSLPNDWIVHKYIRYSIALIMLAVLVVSLRSFMLGQKCILSSRPCSVIGKYIPSVLVVLLCVHWALQGLLFGQLVQIQIRPLVQYFPFVFQMLAIGSILVIWWKPLCCIGTRKLRNGSLLEAEFIHNAMSEETEHDFVNEEDVKMSNSYEAGCPETSIKSLLIKDSEEESGLDERSDFIHGSSLLTNTIIVTLLLAHVTSIGHAPVLTFVPYTVAGLVGIHGNTGSQCSWSAAMSWTLASQFFFYATGHQPLFSSIPWDSAFTIENANSLSDAASSWINWVQPAVSVLCNLYASQILFALTLPMLVFWKSIHSTNVSSQQRLYQMLNICAKFISLHGLKLLSCMVCVTIHRRHLMVWKIFTPKLIFEGVAFIVVYITTFLSSLFILRVQFTYKNEVAKRRQNLVNSYS